MLIDILRKAAAEEPQREAGAGVGPDTDLRRTGCARGGRWPATLRRRGIERFGIAAEDQFEVVALLAAGSAIGSEACVYPRSLDEAGVAEFAERLGHDVVVADEPLDLPGAETCSWRATSESATDRCPSPTSGR